jgi:hypothetical protein
LGNGERGSLKKLIAAAQAWARPAPKPKSIALTVDDEFAKGLRKFRVSEADIEVRRNAEMVQSVNTRADFEVHEDVWDSWLFFLRVRRQWRYVAVSAGMGVTSVRIGLDWPGIESLIRLSRVRSAQWEQLVDDLLLIEEAVLQVDGEVNK